MSAQPKLKAPPAGEKTAAMTQLKKLWLGWDEPARESWRARLSSPDYTQAQNRAAIQSELGITLESDSQLTRFRKWVQVQDAMDAERDRQIEEDRRMLADRPDLTLDQARDELLKISMYRAVLTGDLRGLGLPAVDRLERIQARQFDMEKYAHSIKSKVDAGLDEIAALFQRAPELLEEFNRLRSKLTARISE